MRTGRRTTFTGRLVTNRQGSPAGRDSALRGAALAEAQGHHIEVAYEDLTVEP